MPSLPGPQPPTDDEVATATGYKLQSRTLHRSAHLSTVEKGDIELKDASRRGVFIKTTRPTLAHEIKVYALLTRFDLPTADLLGTGRTLYGDPWMMLSAIGGNPVTVEDETAIALALDQLAEIHSHYLDQPDELRDIPQWSPAHLAKQADHTCEVLSRYSATNPPSQSLLAEYSQRLAAIAEMLQPLGTTLVHGDFDPGNLLCRANHSVAVLDWGLSHRSSPLIDLAHMVERFDEPKRASFCDDYLQRLGIDIPVATAVALGGLAHRAFFIWWHTTVIENGWAPATAYRDLIAQRMRYVVATPIPNA